MNEISSRLACFELWGGNRSADHPVELPGLAGWVYSQPLEPAAGGGDVHYFSVCSKGMVSRVALADVAGHGSGANSMAESLRYVLQRHTDNWDQSALMRELKRGLTIESPVQVSLALMSGVRAFRGDGPRRDDETLLVLRRVIE